MNWPIIFLLFLVATGIFLLLRKPWNSSHSSTPEASHTQESYSLEAAEELSPELAKQAASDSEISKDRSFQFEVSEDLAATPVTVSFTSSVLHVMVRCPKSLYVYWNLVRGEFPVENLTDHYPLGTRAILRLYELADDRASYDNIRHSFDISVDLATDNIYLDVPYANVSYFLELGVLSPDGKFIAWLRSKEVTMPRESISPIIDPAWAPLYGIPYDSDLTGRLAIDSSSLIKPQNRDN